MRQTTVTPRTGIPRDGSDCDVPGFKTLTEEGTGRILGAHLLGQHAEEVINLFGLAIRTGIRASDLKHAVFSYPTSASDLGSMV